MRTSIDAVETAWPEHLVADFEGRLYALGIEPSAVESANYWTPRPYVDEWNRGSDGRHGYTFISRHGYRAEVYAVTLSGPSLLDRCRRGA